MCLAIPGKIVSLVPDEPHLGVVEVTGVRRRVDLGLLVEDMPKIGDWVLIHVGFAMSRISEQDATEQMQLLTMLGEGEAAMNEVRGYGLEERGDFRTGEKHRLGTGKTPTVQ
jgi:hydrogenase expression/formation protein HypC